MNRTRVKQLGIGIAAILFLLVALTLALPWMRARELRHFERECARLGLDLNWRSRVPPVPAPEDNYYDADIVRAWLPPKGKAASGDSSLPATPVLPTGWFGAPLADLEDLAALPRSDGEHSLEALARHFDTFAPGLRMLREAAQRPAVYLPGDYSSPLLFPVPNYVVLRNIAQVLTTQARVHLLLQRSDLALEDLDSIGALMRGLDSKPALLVSAMMRVAVAGLYADVVRDGFSLNAWSKTDCAALRSRLEKIDLVRNLAKSLREGELMGCSHVLARIADSSRAERLRDLRSLRSGSEIEAQLVSFLPVGAVHANLLLAAELLQQASSVFATDGSRLDLEKLDAVSQKTAAEFAAHRLRYILAADFVPNMTKACITGARNQMRLRLGIIACALEEYRFDRGSYPAALGDLKTSLPCDIITGTPPVYRRTASGYQLYSVAENQRDDGGRADDWVW